MSPSVPLGINERLPLPHGAGALIIKSMTKPSVISIGPSERPWAQSSAERSWQRFWGKFELEPETELYIESGADLDYLEMLTRAFLKMPEALRTTCLQWRCTFSFAEGLTASGNSSTFYADFTRTDRRLISPHIEIGSRSRQPLLIGAHLAHELSHLFWRSRTESQREQYRKFLRETCPNDCIEVTEYAQGLFSRRSKHDGMKRWTEESFCETVAVLTSPFYIDFDRDTTVDLVARHNAIESLLGLQLPQCLHT